MELNRVMLVGRLTRDPEFRSTASGRAVANMRLAINRKRGEQDETLFVDATAWEKTAEFAQKYLQKGTAVFVEGRLQQEDWTDRESGQKRTKLSVVIDRMQFAESKRDVQGSRAAGGASDDDNQPALANAGRVPENWGGTDTRPTGPKPQTEDELPF